MLGPGVLLLMRSRRVNKTGWALCYEFWLNSIPLNLEKKVAGRKTQKTIYLEGQQPMAMKSKWAKKKKKREGGRWLSKC